MPRTVHRKSSTMELGSPTRQHLSYIIKHSDTLVTQVGSIRAMAKKFKQFVLLVQQAEKDGGYVNIIVYDKDDTVIQTLPEDFRL